MRLKVQRNRERALNGFHARMFAAGEIETAVQSERVAEILSSVVPPETALAIEALDALSSADMRPQLAGIDLPVLLLHGDRDPICLPQASHYLAEGLRSARRTVFSGCGHAPFLTSPEQFNREIISFVGSIRERSA
jgi:pimeloyl-[acyl-carrier protein] methyl ester esterase